MSGELPVDDELMPDLLSDDEVQNRIEDSAAPAQPQPQSQPHVATTSACGAST